jgi:hypothetical protein
MWFLSGPIIKMVLSTVTDGIGKWRQKASDEARAEADVAIARVNAWAELAKAELHSTTRWVRPAFARMVLIYFWLIVVDSVNITILGFPPEAWVVDRLPMHVEVAFGAIIAFYFAGRPYEKAKLK